MAAIAETTQATKWRAGLAVRRIYTRSLVEMPDGELKQVSFPIDLTYVVVERSKDEAILFCVTRLKGRLVFTDNRECSTGTAGSTGRWGTRPASKPGKRRTLTPTAWIAEVSRLIGRERAEEILRLLGYVPPF